jgi:hypothetical protein
VLINLTLHDSSIVAAHLLQGAIFLAVELRPLLLQLYNFLVRFHSLLCSISYIFPLYCAAHGQPEYWLHSPVNKSETKALHEKKS